MFRKIPTPERDEHCIICNRIIYSHEQYEAVRTKRKNTIFFHTSCYNKQLSKQKGEIK